MTRIQVQAGIPRLEIFGRRYGCVERLSAAEIRMSDDKKQGMSSRMYGTGFWRRFWIPLSVVIFGVLPVIMLIWTQQISDGVRTDYIVESALMDAQIRASSFHLWFEEGIAGDADVDLRTTWADLDRASELLAAILDGGETEHDPVLRPLMDQGKRNRVEEMRSTVGWKRSSRFIGVKASVMVLVLAPAAGAARRL